MESGTGPGDRCVGGERDALKIRRRTELDDGASTSTPRASQWRGFDSKSDLAPNNLSGFKRWIQFQVQGLHAR
jgi:hypothetical protein